ncbi:MAG: sensor histidine kinase [Acidimicrobiales bacterium]
MSYRSRLATVMAAAVTVAIALASVAIYLSVRAQLRGALAAALDRVAVSQAAALDGTAAGSGVTASGLLVGMVVDAQVVTAGGAVTHLGRTGLALPLVARAQQVAVGRRAPFLSEVNVGTSHLLVDTTGAGDSRAIQVAASLGGIDATLHELALVLVAVTAAGLVASSLAAMAATRALMAPLHRLGDTAAQVASTRDLSRRLEVEANDELGRIASTFNTMMSALDQSVRAQRQLVADASHELRTPLTSLRTNLEVLARHDRLSPADRASLTSDLVAQLEELTVLVGDLADLARESMPEPPVDDVDVVQLVAGAVDRARRRAPAVTFEVEAAPALVRGDAGRLSRAVANLLDNAVKWSPAGSVVEVAVRPDGPAAGSAGSAGSAGLVEIEVRDHGPGIPPGDLPFVFERFYRAGGDRRLPGSGLGLAIVRQVAEWHGGSVTAGAASGGGTCLLLRLPLVKDL